MNKIIYHLHTDPKFIFDSDRYSSTLFNNKLILIGDLFEENRQYNYDIFKFKKEVESVTKIIDLVQNADLIIFYGLCDFMRNVLRSISPTSKIAWRFFGYEYYSTRRDLMLTQTTSDLLEGRANYKYYFIYRLRLFFRRQKMSILAKRDLQITRKINYILLFCEEEFLYLNKYWRNVPEFVKLSLYNKFDINDINKESENLNVIVGNSRNIYNNHIDIIDMIPKNYDNANFVFFLNYGRVSAYSKEVEKQAKSLIKSDVYLDFLSKEEFLNVYRKSTTFVLNSHRQMALANIFTAIQFGLKIYLNDKNVIKKWLQNNGILIYSVSQFENDLITNNLSLKREEKISNVKHFNMMLEKFTKEMFCEQIYNLIR